jgi:excinuclease ABC subunit A
VIKLADWVIDLGPEAGDAGGELVAMGRPEEIALVEGSHTGQWLRPLLHMDAPSSVSNLRLASRRVAEGAVERASLDRAARTG